MKFQQKLELFQMFQAKLRKFQQKIGTFFRQTAESLKLFMRQYKFIFITFLNVIKIQTENIRKLFFDLSCKSYNHYKTNISVIEQISEMSSHQIAMDQIKQSNIKRKAQRNVQFMFPQLVHVNKNKNKKKSSNKKIHSDKQIYNELYLIKKQKQQNDYQLQQRTATKNILNFNLNVKQKQKQVGQLDYQNKIKQFLKNRQSLVVKKSSINVQKQKLRQTLRSLNKFRTTFITKKDSSPPQISQNMQSTQNISNISAKKILGNYQIIKQIGHGGFAKVFQVLDNRTNKKYAIKQYNLAQAWECFKNQTKIGEYFFKDQNEKSLKNSFNKNAVENKEACQNGLSSLVRYIQRIKTNKKGYIVQQMCGINFSKLISQIKGTFFNKQRVYQVKFLPFYEQLKSKQILIPILLQICKGIKLLNQNGFVHCDLKLQNILIQKSDNQSDANTYQAKIIDFGSTFQAYLGLPKITITPQYMPPQLLLQFDKNSGLGPPLFYDKIDVWSIGCIMFQIFTGIPLWFRYKCKLDYKGRSNVDLCLFALTNRQYPKIIKKQYELCQKLIKTINFVSIQWECYRLLLKKIFVVNPQKRIGIDQIIQFLQSAKYD